MGYIVVAIEHFHDAIITYTEDNKTIRNKMGRPKRAESDVELEELYKGINKFLQVRIDDVIFTYHTFDDLNKGIIDCKNQEKKESFFEHIQRYYGLQFH